MFASVDVAPDDLGIGPQGSVWVTATEDGIVLELASDGHLLRRFSDPNAPEGIVATDERVLLAEQKRNRIVVLDRSGTTRPFLDLPNHTANPGVDGLGLDAARQLLLIPDSPNGTLLGAPLAGGAPVTLAVNLGRPVAATVGPDGDLYVASESSPGLFRVPAGGGSATPIGQVADLDEVIAVDGLLYVAGISDGTVRAVAPSTGADRALVDGGHELQGLAALPDGRLLLADSATRALTAIDDCRGHG